MKKTSLIVPLLVMIFLVFLASSVLAASADVAYVIKPGGEDSVLLSELDNYGATYNLIHESNVGLTNFSNYKMILVGDNKFDNYNDIPVSQHNSLLVNSHHFFRRGTSSDYQWGWSARRGSASSPTNIELNGLNTSITDNVPETFRAYTMQDPNVHTYYLTNKKATGIKHVAHVGGNSHVDSDAVLSIAYPGTEYLNGNIGEARSLFFGIVHTEHWTTESRQLFRNSLDWVFKGEDLDGDGFFTDDDCDDLNAEINPDAEEIAYDGIDQDCSGSDLTDLDEDGYDADCSFVEGICEIPSGDDCDDNNPEINPGSSDLSMNCVNDPPLVSDIPNYFVFETQSVNVFITATDPEDDPLTYSINDSKFVQLSENSFKWETGYYDEGNHTFEAIVSDGQLETKESFKVEVSNKNQAPILNKTIPNQTWEEDTEHILDLSEYFADLDNDTLEFGVFDTSSDTEISVNITENIANFSVKTDWYGTDWIVFFAFDGLDHAESNNVTLNVTPVNDAPIFNGSISDMEMDEDTQITIDLSKYFIDIDSELSYSLQGNSEISAQFSGNLATLTPSQDWNGQENIKINASDNEFSVESNEFTIKVLPVNDAPVLDFIEDVVILGGSLVEITPSASDIDGDELSFSFSPPLNENGEWQTSKEDAGIHTASVTVNDGNNGTDFQEFEIQVLKRFFINEFVSNPQEGESEWIELYNSHNQEINLSLCEIRDGADNVFDLGGIIGENEFYVVSMVNRLNNGGDILMLYCSGQLINSVTYGDWDDGNLDDNAPLPGKGESASRDPDGTNTDNNFEDFHIFQHPTKGLPSDTDMIPPVIELIAPGEGSLFTITRDVVFEFSASDNEASVLECDVYLNNDLKKTNHFVANNTIEDIFVENIPDGDYIWNVRCYDGFNHAFSEESWLITISAPDAPIFNPIEDKIIGENETLEFTISATDPDLDELFFSVEANFSGFNFTDNGDGTGTFLWTPSYEHAGSYEIKFIVEDSTGLKDTELVEIIVIDQKEPPKFSDINKCESIDSRLIIDIRDPKERDDFEIGEELDIKVDVENNYTEELDVDVEVYLYDIKEEEVIEKEKDSQDIDSDDEERFKFMIIIPEDLDEDEYAVFVLAEGRNGETLCNEEFVYIDVERREHEISIEEVSLSPQIVHSGENIDVSVRVKNLGASDEDVYLEIKNTELGILETSEEFELEEYGDDDTETLNFLLPTPQNIQEGDYELEFRLISDDYEDLEIGSFKIIKEEELEESNVISLGESKGLIKQNKQEANVFLVLFVLLIFVLGVVLLTAFFKKSNNQNQIIK